MGLLISYIDEDGYVLSNSRLETLGTGRSQSHSRNYLILIIVCIVVGNIEEAELIDTLAGADYTEPVAELLLLEVLLCPVENAYQLPISCPQYLPFL